MIRVKLCNDKNKHNKLFRLIYVTDQPYEIIVIKDLTPENYSVFREPPENIEDSKKFVKGIAQFHAASIMLQESVS